MHIDFAPPSAGTYNNAGSSRQLASYMEHEDMERMQQGIYTDGFFNLTEENIYKSKVIKDRYQYQATLENGCQVFRYPCQPIGKGAPGNG